MYLQDGSFSSFKMMIPIEVYLKVDNSNIKNNKGSSGH